MKLFRPDSDRPSRDADLGGAEAWVGRVARALLRRARAEPDEVGADGLWQSGLDPRTLRVDGRSPVDAARTHRLVVQSIMELPPAVRATVLERYRDGRRIEAIARDRRLPLARVRRELSDALDTIASRVRRRSGGGRAVYLAGMALLERELRAGGRPVRRFAPLVAAAAVLIALAAFLLDRDLGDRPGPGIGAEETIAGFASDRTPIASPSFRDSSQLASVVETAGAVDLLADEASYGIQVVGQVRDATGRPLESGRRHLGYLRARHEGAQVPGAERVVSIDVAGRFSLAGLSAGSWTLTAQLDGYVTASRTLELVDSPETVFVELVTRTAERVDVRVFVGQGQGVHAQPGSADDWAILYGLSAAMTREPASERLPLPSVERSWHRIANFERLAPADMARPALVGTLVAERPERARWVHLVFGEYVLASAPWQPGVNSVRFDVEMARIDALRASVRLQLQSLLGDDIAGAEVTLFGPNGEVLLRRVGPDGLLDLGGLPPGSWTVEAWLRGHGRLLLAFDLDPGGEFESDELELGAPIHLSGSVLDLAGNPIGALLRALPFDNLEHPFLFDQSPTTTAYPLGDGKFDFGEDLSGGSDWVVVLDEPGYALKAEVVGEHGAKVDFYAEPGNQVTMTWGSDDALDGRYVLLRDDQGLPLKAFALTDDLGFSVQLSSGQYNLVLWENGSWGKQIPFQVQNDGTSVPIDW